MITSCIRRVLLMFVLLGFVVAGPRSSCAQEATATPLPQVESAPPPVRRTVRLSREPVKEELAGAKTHLIVRGHRLALGAQSFSARQLAHPRSREGPRTLRAREWRAPWCTLWRDECERCKWSPEDGRVTCFTMAADGAACKRSDIVCEDVDENLLINECAYWNNGCNSCQLHGSKKQGFMTPCSAMWCSPSVDYKKGYTCEKTWDACRSDPESDICRLGSIATREFRELKRAQMRALLKAYERR